MAISVRPYQRKDADMVQMICIVCSGLRRPTLKRRNFSLLTYCNYYIEQEPKNCFVAVDTDEDGEEKVVGYVLCSEDCYRFASDFRDKYLPEIKKLGRTGFAIARGEAVDYGKFATFFPAHMHINVMPAYQRQGIGTMLTKTLVEHLKEKSVKGVLLKTDKKNMKCLKFCIKFGFENLGKIPGGYAMGFDLDR